MNRLPHYDAVTRRDELVVFVGLGLLAVAVTGGALHDAARFAENREAVTALYSTGQVGTAQFVMGSTNNSGTNITAVRHRKRNEHTS